MRLDCLIPGTVNVVRTANFVWAGLGWLVFRGRKEARRFSHGSSINTTVAVVSLYSLPR